MSEKRELTGGDYPAEPTLTLSVNKEPNIGMFQGEYLGMTKPEGVGQYNKHIHAFRYRSSTIPITIKQENKYVPVEMEAGEQVIMFANDKLHAALLKAEKGMILEIVTSAKQKSPTSGRYFNPVVISVVE